MASALVGALMKGGQVPIASQKYQGKEEKKGNPLLLIDMR